MILDKLTKEEKQELERLLILRRANVLKSSLFEFYKEFWDVLYSNEYEHNWHNEYLCDELQLVIDKYVLDYDKPRLPLDKWYKGFGRDIKKNFVCCIAPGTGKSTIISRISTGWLWANDPSKTELNNTISDSNSNGFSKDSKDVVESKKYQMYFPNVKIRKDVSAKTFFETTSKGIRYSSTTMSKDKTGKHADILKDDDQMDYNTAQSPVEAKRCIEGFKAMQSRKKDKRKTPYVLFMQRLSKNDTVAHALRVFGDNVKLVCLPAELKHNNVEPAELSKYYINGLLDPNRLSLEVLANERKGLNDESKPMSEMAYEIQYNQLEVSSDDLMYKDIKIVDKLPEHQKGGVIKMSFTDVADTGQDYFCTWFIAIINEKIYVYDCVYTQRGSEYTSGVLAEKIKANDSFMNYIETNNQGSVFITLMRQLGVNCQGYTSTGNKLHRINAWCQFVKYIYFVNNTSPEYQAALKHIQNFPSNGLAVDSKDDAEDALTEMLRYCFQNFRSCFSDK